jgi:hypothetical protein
LEKVKRDSLFSNRYIGLGMDSESTFFWKFFKWNYSRQLHFYAFFKKPKLLEWGLDMKPEQPNKVEKKYTCTLESNIIFIATVGPR